MTTQDRIAALERFGYDYDEAYFLVIAALHSGYFVRRQFLGFVKRTNGWRDDGPAKEARGPSPWRGLGVSAQLSNLPSGRQALVRRDRRTRQPQPARAPAFHDE